MMLADKFFSLFAAWKPPQFAGLGDFTDKLNFIYTPIIMLTMTSISMSKSYMIASIACYCPNVFTGGNHDDYLINYCWVHGTIPIPEDAKLPTTNKEWDNLDKDRIQYYQWVPFMLGFQCILFYIPRIIWETFCNNRVGINLEYVVKSCDSAQHCDNDGDAGKLLKYAVVTLDRFLCNNRQISQSTLAKIKWNLTNRIFLLTTGNSLDACITTSYLFIKLIHFLNAVLQLYLIKVFLQSNDRMFFFGWHLMMDLIQGFTWRQSLMFPRVSYCHGKIRHLGARDNAFTAICALPVNMLNEKIYIFLWFWCFMLILVNFFSLIAWMLRLGSHRNDERFIRKQLKITQTYNSATDEKYLNDFLWRYLRTDGFFILRMIRINAGDVTTCTVVKRLWMLYKKKASDAEEKQENHPSNNSLKQMYI